MKSRGEAHQAIKNCVALIKAETNKDVLKLTSDNGTEFTSNRSKQFYAQNGIIHITSAPFTPQ